MKYSINMAVLKNLQNGVISKREKIISLEYPEWNSKTGNLISEEEYREFLAGLE